MARPTRSPCSPSRARWTARARTAGPYATGRRPTNGPGGLRQGRRVQGQHHHVHPQRPAQRLQRAREPAGVRAGQEVGRPRRRRVATTSSPPVPTCSRAVGGRRRAAPSSATRTGTGPATPCAGPTPTEIPYQEGLDTQAVAQQVMADGDTGRLSVSLGSAPPAIQQHITAVQSLRGALGQPAHRCRRLPRARTPRARCSRTRRCAVPLPPRPTAMPTSPPSAGRPPPTPPSRSSRAPSPPRTTPTRSAPAPRGPRAGQGAPRRGRAHRAGAVHRRLPLEPHVRQGHGGPRGRLAAGRVRPDDPSRSPTTTSRRSATPGSPREVDVFWSQLGARLGLGVHGPAAAVRQLDQHHERRPRARLRLLGRHRSSTPRWPRSRRSPTGPSARRPGRRSTPPCSSGAPTSASPSAGRSTSPGPTSATCPRTPSNGGVVEFADIAVVR